jgi:GGDEF domain-containing protein
VIWSAVRAELHDPAPDEIAELAERLALVIEHVRMAVLRSLEGRGPRGSAAAPTAAAGPHLAPAAPPETFEASGDTRFEPSGATRFEPSGDTRFEPPRDTGAAPEPLWVGALEDEIDRSHRTGTPLSLLLTELDEADRVLAVEGETMAESVFGRFAQSVRSAVRRQDTLACETDTRAWIIARDTGRLGAQALAERVVEAVHESPSWRGAPLGVTVGVAVLGEDGGTTSELIEAAEEDRFAAAASGIAITRGDQGDAGDDLPDADG